MKKILVSLLSLALIVTSFPMYAFGAVDKTAYDSQNKNATTYNEAENYMAKAGGVEVVKDDSIASCEIFQENIMIKPAKDEVNLIIKDENGNVFDLYSDPNCKRKINGKVHMSEQGIIVYAKLNDVVYLVVLFKGPMDYNFADIKGDEWYAQHVEYVAATGIVRGYEVDGKLYLRPEDKTTRIEGAIFMLRILGVETTQFKDVKLKFDDYDENSYATAWSANYVKAAYELGLLKGSAEGDKLYLHGQSNISREEFFEIFARVIKLMDNNEGHEDVDLSIFEDSKEIKPWFADSIKFLVYNEIIEGKVENGKRYIYPEDDIRRCEIIKMLSTI